MINDTSRISITSFHVIYYHRKYADIGAMSYCILRKYSPTLASVINGQGTDIDNCIVHAWNVVSRLILFHRFSIHSPQHFNAIEEISEKITSQKSM